MKLGLDIGGTNSVFGVVNQEGKVLATDSLKTAAYAKASEFVENAKLIIEKLATKVGGMQMIDGMGIAAPNANYYTGEIVKAPNVRWAHNEIVPLAKMMQEAIGVPCALTNDANAAALGEKKYGCAKNIKDFIMITLGTGLGSGIIADDKLLYGKNGMAGELGHTYREEAADRCCGCGKKGCLETICSATGVANTARRFLQESNEPSLLREKLSTEITSYDVSIAAEKGDALAKRVYDFTGEVLGKACADFATFLSPEAFVFFGGMAKSGDLLLNPLKRAFDENVLHVYKNEVKFLVSSIEGSNAAVIGAAAVAP